MHVSVEWLDMFVDEVSAEGPGILYIFSHSLSGILVLLRCIKNSVGLSSRDLTETETMT